MMFFLGTHEVHWLAVVKVPLFVSRRRLARRSSLPKAATSWALDSGGFTELSMHGKWTITALQYADAVRRYQESVGLMEWAAPQDWMCEPFITAKTGKSVLEHQRRTVGNFIDLKSCDVPVIPVLQGYTLSDYLHCVELYAQAGIDLREQHLVGLGSVCRRQASHEIGDVCAAMHDLGISNLHGFGCKSGAIKQYGHMLKSADSLAWSFNGRRNGSCKHLKSRCANCLHFALEWRTRTLSTPPSGWHQPRLNLESPA